MRSPTSRLLCIATLLLATTVQAQDSDNFMTIEDADLVWKMPELKVFLCGYPEKGYNYTCEETDEIEDPLRWGCVTIPTNDILMPFHWICAQ